MARVVTLTCLLLFCFISQKKNEASAISILFPIEAMNFVLELKENIEKIQDMLAPEKSEQDQMKPENVAMLNKLDSLDSNINRLREDLLKEIDNLPSKITDYTNNLYSKINLVNKVYQEFLIIKNSTSKFQPQTVDKFFEASISTSNPELPAVIVEMHNIFTQADIQHASILSLLSEKNQAKLMCINGQSLQHILNELYNMVIETDTLSVAIRLFAYNHKESKENLSYEYEKKVLIDGFNRRINKTYIEVKNVMTSASREIYRCDPQVHQIDRSYSKMQEIFQSTLVFERDMKKDCLLGCSDYHEETTSCESYFCSVVKENKKKQCTNGRLRNCMSMSANVTVCYSNLESERLYEWISTETGVKYGHNPHICKHRTVDKAPEGVKPSDVLKIWWQYMKHFSTRECSFCLCTCDDHNPALVRYFSLHEVKSDVKNNKVITGVKFEKKDRVFYIKIQEGQLGSNGTIKSTEWKDIEPIKKRLVDKAMTVKKSKHVYPVNWDQRKIYLDEIEDKMHKNKVLTGLRFKRVGNDLSLQAELTSFDFAKGHLINSEWQSRSLKKRSDVYLKQSDDPLLYNNNKVNSEPGQYIEFQSTNLDKDVGQLTIPFIDLQQVESTPPVPISGVGLIHRSDKNAISGGFLAFKLLQYDISSRM